MVEVEEGIQTQDLPAVVQETVKIKYPKETIDNAERKTVDELMTYELRVLLGKNGVDMEIDSNGKALKEHRSTTEGEDKEDEV